MSRIGLVLLVLMGPGNQPCSIFLARREEADEGHVSFSRTARVGYLTQIADFSPQNTLREELLSFLHTCILGTRTKPAR